MWRAYYYVSVNTYKAVIIKKKRPSVFCLNYPSFKLHLSVKTSPKRKTLNIIILFLYL